MSVSLAPSPWSVATGAPRGLPWVFGREVVLSGVPGAPRALQWPMRRNCSITPRQLGLVFLSLCAVSLLISAAFYVQGAPFVLAFAGIELTAVGLAMLVFARHAGDRETLTLVGRSLQVEQCFGARVERTDFAAEWLSVEPAAGQGSLVELSGRGGLVRVGRFLRPELRAAFARELRQALRRPLVQPAPDTDAN
jgi:uncharacterized membrane protein